MTLDAELREAERRAKEDPADRIVRALAERLRRRRDGPPRVFFHNPCGEIILLDPDPRPVPHFPLHTIFSREEMVASMNRLARSFAALETRTHATVACRESRCPLCAAGDRARETFIVWDSAGARGITGPPGATGPRGDPLVWEEVVRAEPALALARYSPRFYGSHRVVFPVVNPAPRRGVRESAEVGLKNEPTPAIFPSSPGRSRRESGGRRRRRWRSC